MGKRILEAVVISVAGAVIIKLCDRLIDEILWPAKKKPEEKNTDDRHSTVAKVSDDTL